MTPIKVTSKHCYGTFLWIDTINYNNGVYAVCINSNNEITLINIKDIKISIAANANIAGMIYNE